MMNNPKDTTRFTFTQDELNGAYGCQELLEELMTTVRLILGKLTEAAAARAVVDPAELLTRVEGRIGVMQVNAKWTIGREVTRWRDGTREHRRVDMLGTALTRPNPPAALVSYMSLVINRTAWDAQRADAARRRRDVDRADGRRGLSEPESDMPDAEWVRVVWDKLPPLEREVVRLRLVQGRTESQAQEALNLSRGQVQRTCKRALSRMWSDYTAVV